MNRITLRIVTALYLAIPVTSMNPVMANDSQENHYINSINHEVNDSTQFQAKAVNSQFQMNEKRKITWQSGKRNWLFFRPLLC